MVASPSMYASPSVNRKEAASNACGWSDLVQAAPPRLVPVVCTPAVAARTRTRCASLRGVVKECVVREHAWISIISTIPRTAAVAVWCVRRAPPASAACALRRVTKTVPWTRPWTAAHAQMVYFVEESFRAARVCPNHAGAWRTARAAPTTVVLVNAAIKHAPQPTRTVTTAGDAACTVVGGRNACRRGAVTREPIASPWGCASDQGHPTRNAACHC